MKRTKILALALAVVMICSLFAGCSLWEKTIIEIDDVKISENVYTAALNYANALIEQQLGTKLNDYLDMEIFEGGITGAQYLKDETDLLLCELALAEIIADDYGIKLTKEEEKITEDKKQSQIDYIGGRKEFLQALEQSGINEEYYDFSLRSDSLFAKIYQELFLGDGELALTADQVADKLLEGNYVRVKHVLVMGKSTDADFNEKKALAEDIAKRAKNGEDFEELINTYGEDPGMESNPDGYLFDKDGYTADGTGQMVAEFTEASNALEVGGVSGIVQSEHGFHIIKRYPFTREYIIENKTTYESMVATEAFTAKMQEYSDKVEIKRTSNYDKVDVHKALGVEKKLGVEEHYEGDGHDHSTEAE